MKYRGDQGGSLVFRPVGLLTIMECIEKLSTKNNSMADCVRLISRLPRNLAQEPFADVLWDTRTHAMVNKNRVLTRNLLLYMLGELRPSDGLLKSYAAAMGKEVEDVQLPVPLT